MNEMSEMNLFKSVLCVLMLLQILQKTPFIWYKVYFVCQI